MANDHVDATTVIDHPAEAIFAVLADPAKHAAVDGTGWVGKAVDREPLTATGQISSGLRQIGGPLRCRLPRRARSSP